MKKIMFTFLILLAMLPLSLPSVEAQTPPTITNASVHDPSVIEVDGEYFIFGSHLSLAKSPDLINWQQIEGDGVNAANSLFVDVTKELEETLEWAQSNTLWAPDVVQLNDGRFYMYYNACEGSSPRSALGIAVSEKVDGPYEDLGIILRSGMTPEESQIIDGTPYDEVHYPELYDATIHPNVVDPHVFFDKEGKLWMVYGSYSGGIFILELDPSNGMPYANQGYGTKLIGGNHSRIEGPYIVYNQATDAYYLYLSYGGLDSVGGYNVRIAKSDNPDGPYYDIQGNDMRNVKGEDGSFFQDEAIAQTGAKIIGNHLFKSNINEPGAPVGYVSPGHNSVYVDKLTGQQFLIFHSRFPNQGEKHEVRVHQLFMNEDGWPVAAPFRYYNDQLLEDVTRESIEGSYKVVLFTSEISDQLDESVVVYLESDGSISGERSGTWEVNNSNITITINDDVYKGVVLQQWNPIAQEDTLTFTALSSNGLSLWGVASTSENVTDQEIVDIVANELDLGNTNQVVSDLVLPTEINGTKIQWKSSNPQVITDTGEITRPPIGSEPAHAILTASLTKGEATATRSFDIYVMPSNGRGLVANYDFEGHLINRVSGEEASVTGDRINNQGGNITFTDGKFGRAAMFDGNSGILLPDGLIQSNQYSVSFWLNPEQLTSFTTSFFGSQSPNNWISLVPGGGIDNRVDWMLWSGEQWFDGFSDEEVMLGEWNHLAFTVDDSTLSLYMNGELVKEYQGFPNVFQSIESVFALGVNYWDTPYKGLIDEVMVFDNYVLTESEVTDLYQSNAFSIDRSDLDSLLNDAQKYAEDQQYTQASRQQLKNVIEKILSVEEYTNFDQLEQDIAQLGEAMDQLEKQINEENEDTNLNDQDDNDGGETNDNNESNSNGREGSELDDSSTSNEDWNIEEESTEDSSQNPLPNTATNIFNWLLIGIGFLLCGGFILVVLRRNVKCD